MPFSSTSTFLSIIKSALYFFLSFLPRYPISIRIYITRITQITQIRNYSLISVIRGLFSINFFLLIPMPQIRNYKTNSSWLSHRISQRVVILKFALCILQFEMRSFALLIQATTRRLETKLRSYLYPYLSGGDSSSVHRLSHTTAGTPPASA
jgi:hypothetical protein